MTHSWLVILPSLIVIALATITRRVRPALVAGIISAALIACDFNIFPAIHLIALRFLEKTELMQLTSWHGIASCYYLFILAFLFIIGILTAVIQHSGAAHAYSNFVMKRITTPKGAERSSLLLSILLFIDDYFPCLTVGAIMQPVTDQFKVPRAKLAVLVSFIAAPLSIVAPLSTWVAFILTQLRSAGVSTQVTASTLVAAEPFAVYIRSIPYMLYVPVVVFSLWYLVSRRLSYGIIAQQEHIAQITGNLFGGKAPILRRSADIPPAQTSTLIDFLFPIILLFASIFGSILYLGDWIVFGGHNTLLRSINGDVIPAAFFYGGLFTVIATLVFFIMRSRISLKALGGIITEGVSSQVSTALTLLFIWTLSVMLYKDLQTGNYLAGILSGYMNLQLLPLIFFLLAATIAMLMGTAWGTMTMLIPLGLGMLPSLLGINTPLDLSASPFLFALIGAIVSGSVVGNHVSPIADVMLMTATTSGAYHLDVVKSQLSLSLPTLFSASCAFATLGILIQHYNSYVSAAMSILVGLIINITLLHMLTWLDKRNI
ncbi:MAG: Na+/H+ antiporter NhaC family protein [Candidatus Babeliales bacterium]|jgi:Na+/H+ antiporter NhaC